MKLSLELILASKSPRRQELLNLMGIEYKLKVKDVEETYPTTLKPIEVPQYIAKKKAEVFTIESDKLILTADTLVCIDSTILGKPKSEQEAFNMLSLLSGRTHEVFTAICLKYRNNIEVFVDTTRVEFQNASDKEIFFYINNYKPFDKAGSYGIQDWWGVNMVKKIEGSYTNVMGLPTELLYNKLKSFMIF